MMTAGTLQAIYLVSEKGATPRSVESVTAVAGKGLQGDRFFDYGATHPAPAAGPHRSNEEREVTLIEAEAVEALARDYQVAIDPGDPRRNLVVRGIALNHLVGVDFRVGEVVLRGHRLCEPCGHLAQLTSKEVSKGLIHRGGLRAQILRGGTLRVGDEVSSDAAWATST